MYKLYGMFYHDEVFYVTVFECGYMQGVLKIHTFRNNCGMI